MGRRPDANAIRRAKDRAEISQAASPSAPSKLEKPLSVMISPAMSELWDLFAGSGIAYKAEDAPMMEQLVFDLAVAAECRDKCVDESGRVRVLVGCGEPDPDTGEYPDSRPNPYLKQMREAVAEAMKIADQLGCTPMARARLGLTQAAGIAVTQSIADVIDAAVRRAR